MLLLSDDTQHSKVLQYPSISLKSFLNLYRRIDRYTYLILTKMIKGINQVKDMNQQALCFTALAILLDPTIHVGATSANCQINSSTC